MSEENLFADFKPHTLADWRQKIEKDLKGKSVSSFHSQLEEDITIRPMYTKESWQPEQSLAVASKRGWQVVQEILVDNEKEDKKKALDYLNKGASALLFYLGPKPNLKTLLQDILIEHIHIHFVTEGNGIEVWNNLNKIIKERGLKYSQIRGSINIDCMENLSRSGNWFKDEVTDLEEIQKLTKATPEGLKSICVNSNLFANAGATLSQQLGITLSIAYEYIHRLELKSTNKFWFNFAIGSNYFGEISKLRAFRRLWQNLQVELNLIEDDVHIYCENCQRNKSKLDVYNNIIRTTSETMAAVIGGCDELSIKPLISSKDNSETLESRISRNQQLIAQYEAHLDAVSDIAQGSYFIENLTEELAQKSWKFFKAIEEQGGYVETLRKAWLQEKIEVSAEVEQKAFDENQKILIGANKYRKEEETIKPKSITAKSYRGKIVKPIIAKRLTEEMEGCDTGK